MDPSQLSRPARKMFGQIEFDKDEKLLYEIRKHPFGLFLIYFVGLFVAAALFIALLLTAVFFDGDPLGLGFDVGAFRSVFVLAGAVLSILALLGTALGAYLYQSNVVILTNEKIAQVLYSHIFDRKISQLSIGDVQDVTVEQKGIFARIFNYGTLMIETAGEQKNLMFTFAPKPYECSKAIVSAHEENLKLFGN